GAPIQYTTFSPNIHIEGDMWANGSYFFNSDTFINGNISATGLVHSTEAMTVITGEVVEGVAPLAATPSLNSGPYDAEIAIALATGGGTIKTLALNLAPGNTYVNGDVIILPNGSITAGISPSTIIATGNVDLGNLVKTSGNLSVIAGGTLTIGSGVDLAGLGVWYSVGNVIIGNNSILGDNVENQGFSLVTTGEVLFNDNCDFNGLLYSGSTGSTGNFDFNGNLICGFLASIGSNSSFIRNSTLVDADNIPGFSLGDEVGGEEEIEAQSWQEIY
ncbi:MAG: hypothetical protein KJ811_02715, partial [Candidatus Margulisbacteria bacterium]|nr:hypothetical protein [Candidatus Margulisiibacteriota bacterium]